MKRRCFKFVDARPSLPHAAEGGYSPKDGVELACGVERDKSRGHENDSQLCQRRAAPTSRAIFSQACFAAGTTPVMAVKA